MKRIAIWGILLIMVSGYVYGQSGTPCPGRALTFNSTTLPGLVLPVDTTRGLGITVGSGNSTEYITTQPDSTTILISAVQNGTPPAIVFTSNFQTNVGTHGVFQAYLAQCGPNPQANRNAMAGRSPAMFRETTSLLVYPTVSTGLVTVTGNSTNLGNTDILVVDASGRTVYHLHNDSNTTVNLYLGKLANGLYFLRVNNASGAVLTQRIIINK